MSILRHGGWQMDSKSRYTLRTDPVLLEKLGYIAEYEGRTKNRELEQMIKRRIAAFEQEHGEIPAHEFHYFDSENCGSDFHAAKPMSKRGWDCMHSSSNLLAGYPHIYYYGNPQIPRTFLMKCLEYHNKEF